MAEVFEIQIINKKPISLKLINDNLQDLKFLLKTIYCVDDWSYSNTRFFESHEIDTIDMLNDGKIIVLEGELRNNNCGLFVSKEGKAYCYDFWISTNSLRNLAVESITKDNIETYNLILNTILKNVTKNDLVYCAIGVETSIIKEDATVNTVIENSTGVIRWIIPENETIYLKDYKEEVMNGFKIFSHYF